MKSRSSFVYIWFAFLLLFSQHVAFAGALTFVQQTAFDHQCTLEEGDSADGNLSKHLALDEFDDGASSLSISAFVPQLIVARLEVTFEQFLSVASLPYRSRAPPLV
ncbi:hypothetical protein ACFQPC_06590 [Herminiimonas glaciei]|uniref:Uncharacterized protein n=1 Tax=Herminiimonas glaciei TaxID=523788 RepID=A0ABW2I9T2_9BURK